MNILVRNLSKGVTEKELLQVFLPFGRIKSLSLVIDRLTGKSKGFGFVDMPVDSEGAAAIKALNGKLIRGQKVRVKTTTQGVRSAMNQTDRAHRERFEGREPNGAGKGRNSGTSGARRQKPHR